MKKSIKLFLIIFYFTSKLSFMILLSLITSVFIILLSFIIEKYIIYCYNIKKVNFLEISNKNLVKFASFDYIDTNEINHIIHLYKIWYIKYNYNELLLNIKNKDFTNTFLLRDNYWYFNPDKDLKFYLGTLKEQNYFDFYDFIYNINISKEEKKKNLQNHIFEISKNLDFNTLKFIFS